MTNGEAINWIINISADIGKAEHRDLWRYEQALSEIREMLESKQPDIPDTNVGDTISRQSAIDEIARWIGYLDDDMIGRIQLSLKRLPSADRPQKVIAHIAFGEEKLREIVKEAVERFKAEYEITDRPQGEWIGEADGYSDGELVYDTWYCSNCDYVVDDKEPPTWSFCPNCGSYNGGESDD